ncbi:MAG: glutamine-hydrolyzing carbamoyl-phosphate synthase small subunit [Ruminococcus sp.]|nr:carbamoyl phosphate synthase small subunit [uncultured Ruminococcus sp.]MBQ1350146.1 glutamine-hydrolyzing carbamoyl-phosphate synthase small subunit [Ruminococcus sp.]MBQ2470435.1 glutamine-hydrolyzing carbamoyl-phosphate synthase small subunit [Ruminococcus sp.]MBQ4170648.1 glutamine-hydrolyzing carbamoyl-phosphate synthase small subunit [Ruminococcus sp.]MBQ4262574.1 glutamine-hydrolyzing carbamoyl-phosphate synthase small subunit [Ruminococcus sp.]
MSRAAYLVLENGTVFEGKSFGAEKETTGELVFTTAMTGYLETLTDPSYFGQVVLQTFPLIGNYGVIRSDFETPTPALNGYIVREWCQAPSNFRCEGNLDTFLKEKNVPGICGIDTRALTRIVREYGVMTCRIQYTPEVTDDLLAEMKNYVITDAVESTTITEKETFPVDDAKYHVVLMDFGAKHNIGRELNKRGCSLTVVPAGTAAEEVLALNPDGVMLSNGPGDPAKNTAVIAELKKLSDSGVPMFGICLGHQLLALARGAQTEKLKYGHRGANQPVKELASGKVYITSQNHGYAVVSDSLPSDAVVSYVNGNDNTCEGVSYTDIPAFSVQFHPEAHGGPLDTSFLFDRFLGMMDEHKQ